MGVHVVVVSHTSVASPFVAEGRERRRNLVHGLPSQNLDGSEEVGEVPGTDGLGHDVFLQIQMSWDLGLLEEDHALRTVGHRVGASVMLQVAGPGHIRELEQRLVALTVQLVEGVAEIILVLELACVLGPKHQGTFAQRPSAAAPHRESAN